MKRFLKHIIFILFVLTTLTANAQNGRVTTTHKVEKGETIYGISHKYGVTVDELTKANPDMMDPGFALKTGEVIVIPAKGKPSVSKSVNKSKAINIGVMLPLNNTTEEGRNMVEYYRGILMACDYLKREHYNINVHAWNVPHSANINNILMEKGASECDVIFGPYYSDQIAKVGGFAKAHDIRLAVPFATDINELANNPNMFVLSEFNPQFNEGTCNKFLDIFGNKINAVIVDCNDAKHAKGSFTMTFRKILNEKDIKYNITNLRSDDYSFRKAFKKNKRNIVVLNSAGSNEFSYAVEKLNSVRNAFPGIEITILGYPEWFMFEQYKFGDFAKYDVHIPTFFYYNSHSAGTKRIEADYYKWFECNMHKATPRFAIAGYDHANYFIRGFAKFGKSFSGAREQNTTGYVQMPLSFNKVSLSGGRQNDAFMFIHYKKDKSIESIAY